MSDFGCLSERELILSGALDTFGKLAASCHQLIRSLCVFPEFWSSAAK